MNKVQLVIADPDSLAPEFLIKSSNILFIGYLSVGEVESYRWYWQTVKGKPWILDHNPHWPGSRYVDVRAQEWQELLLSREIPRILEKGYQGVFL